MPRLGTDSVDALFAKVSQFEAAVALFHYTVGLHSTRLDSDSFVFHKTNQVVSERQPKRPFLAYAKVTFSYYINGSLVFSA